MLAHLLTKLLAAGFHAIDSVAESEEGLFHAIAA
jgi:hypothetical protein